jgi:hypothetical protein
MGSAFMMGIELVKVAIQHGWVDRGPGGCHPYVLVKPGCRPVPVRDKLQNRFEAQALMKELSIPRADWPAKLR